MHALPAGPPNGSLALSLAPPATQLPARCSSSAVILVELELLKFPRP